LLGINRTRISRYEKNEEVPAFATALGLQVIFDQQPKFTFPRLYDLVEEGVMQRAAELERAIDGLGDYASARKRHLLDAMMARATSRGGA
jgi:hypothetical protein